MSNTKVSYELFKLNRQVQITIRGLKTTMRYRDFKNIVEAHECELSKCDSLVTGPNVIFEVDVDSKKLGTA
jgi:hypothetical protein